MTGPESGALILKWDESGPSKAAEVMTRFCRGGKQAKWGSSLGLCWAPSGTSSELRVLGWRWVSDRCPRSELKSWTCGRRGSEAGCESQTSSTSCPGPCEGGGHHSCVHFTGGSPNVGMSRMSLYSREGGPVPGVVLLQECSILVLA